jgi:hypothetical protein
MAQVSIRDVTVHDPEQRLGKFHIGLTPGQMFGGYSVTIDGWFEPADAQTQLWLVIPARSAQHVPLNVYRADLTEAGIPPSMVGFRVAPSVVSLPIDFKLLFVARHPAQEDARLATVHVSRERLPVATNTRMQPIMLTSLGRTGGTWVTHLLGKHPRIVALRPFDYEARIAGYWMSVFASLAEPKSYLQSLGAEALGDYWWLGQRNLGPLPSDVPAPAFVHWLGEENIEELLSSFVDRIESAYDQVASLDQLSEAERFVERYWPNSIVLPMMWEVFPGAREVVLVRDFRDMTASIFAYNKKRGRQYFGRDQWDNDEDFVRSLGASAQHLLDSWKQRADLSYLLRYEDLIGKPKETLSSLLDYLGLANGADVIEEMFALAGRRTEAQNVHQTSKSTAASIGRWRGDLDEHMQEVVEDTFSPVLAELGY